VEGASAHTAECDAADSLDDIAQRIVDVVIPETQDVPTSHAHVAISARIIFALGIRAMGGTIYLDNQTRANADEVGNIRTDRVLSPKADTMHVFPYARPQHRFGIGQFSPQRACM
jgi:hypothetical protein